MFATVFALRSLRPRVVFLLVLALVITVPAAADLTISPLTWNIVGLDSNSPATGPKNFPVGARVCSDVATTDVDVEFLWESANVNINLRPGSLQMVTIPSIPAGGCRDAYFEAEITPVPAAYGTTRRYRITATDLSGAVSTPTPRELFVEKLISQNRNSITSVAFGPDALNLTTVPPGGAMNLVVGNTYAIQLRGGTATQGYNQFEAFINFSNTIFQILSVETTYSANNSPYVSNPSDKLWADACLWENDPNSPKYRSCVGGDFKAGGSNVVTTYTIRIVGGGGATEKLNTLLYDFSGASYHYNADYETGAVIANVIDPTNATIAKSFGPNPTNENGVSALTITIGNPNPGVLTGYSFVDNLPADMEVAATPAVTTSGCGAPTVTAVAGSGVISFSNGTIAANGSCVVKVNVTPTAIGTLTNTTDNLFIDTTDTGQFAEADLVVNDEPPPGTGICGVTLAQWTFPTGFDVNAPAPSTAIVTASASAGEITPFSGTDQAGVAGSASWGSNGGIATGATLSTTNNDYFEFALDTTGYSEVYLQFGARRANNGPRGIAVFFGTAPGNPETGTQVFNDSTALSAGIGWVNFGGGDTIAFTTGLNPSGTTFFRIYAFNANNSNPSSDVFIDNVTFTGCAAPDQPAITKVFAPNPVAVNGVSTLTFTLTNPNTVQLTGAQFTDTLPSGLQVAATPAASTTCTGGVSWAPTAGSTSLQFGQTTGYEIPASGSCTASVDVVATTSGPHTNVSGFLSTTEGGTNTSSVATASLTAVLPPVIAKLFAPNPILEAGVSTLTFTITNPNQDDSIGGVAFTDTFPAIPGSMVVAAIPNASATGCGAPTFSPVAGAGSIAFSGGTIAAGGTCVVEVDVTAPTIGTYVNTSGNVSYVINAQTVNGNTASDTLEVEPPSPAIEALKQVGPTATGPWSSFLPVSGGSVHYLFTIENAGDVPLSNITITDDTLDVSTCNTGFVGLILPVASAANDDHIVTCVAGPVAVTPGLHTNTAHATGTFNATPFDSDDSSATYATTGLTLDKTAAETSFSAVGDAINYSYLVTNSGFATLEGPVTVTDDKVTVTCPALSTIGDFDNFFDPGEFLTCTAQYLVTLADIGAGFVTNIAFASAEGVNSANDSVTVNFAAQADVSITKTLQTAGPFIVGQTVTYELVVANAGPSTATNVQVTDTPTNLTITGVSGGGCAALPCTIASLAMGESATITVEATIDTAGAFDNEASVAATETDPDTTNNTDDTGNGGNADPAADVSITKTLQTAGPFLVGQTVTYELVVANAGPSTATNVQVTDTPTNLTITSVSGGGCAALPCTIASLAMGDSATITVEATIDALGTFDNEASVAADEADPDPTDNTDDSGNDGSTSSADMSITKTPQTAGPFLVGQTVTYELVVANAGPSTATNVQVTDTPTNLTITTVSGGGCAALPCTIASLAMGASATITVEATIDAAGAFDNEASVDATETDPDLTDNTDDTGNGGSADPAADVSITKTLQTAGPFVVGQTVTYELVVANAGPSTATNVQLADTPTNLTITTVSGGGCAALPCTIASLAMGASETITVEATIDAAGAFDNEASVAADEADPDTTNNTDDSGNGGNATDAADVSITKTLQTAGPFLVGQTIEYELVIDNAGPSTATNVQVTDTPTNLTITSVSGGGCAALPCTIASLAMGASATITIEATIDAAGAFDNEASVSADEADPDTTNNTDDTGNGGNADPAADVSITKTLQTAGPFVVGQTVTYELVVANAGPSTATNVQVTDTPTNLTITNVSGGGCAALPCTIASLAMGESATITVEATIDAAGAFDNEASVAAAETDPDTTNNTDDTGNGGNADPAADVSITKTLQTAGPFIVGQTVTYELVVANAGPSTATNVQVTDTPTNLTITSVSGGGCAALPCTIASLAMGESATITVEATIDTAGAFDNEASVAADETDPDPTDNTDDTGNDGSTSSADVSITKTLITAGPFTAGQTIEYELVVANAGPSTATNVQVTDTPTNLTITNVSGGGCAALPCTIASLALGESATITVEATIDAAGAFDNEASVDATEFDPDLTNNTDDSGNGGTATDGATVDLAITKSASAATVFLNQPFSFVIDITNLGPSIATAVVMTDDLPATFALDSAVTTQGTCAGTTTVTCTVGTMNPGATVQIVLTGRPTAIGLLENTASVAANEAETTLANNASTAAPQVVAAGIPTLGEWGLILLGMLLALVGVFYIRPQG